MTQETVAVGTVDVRGQIVAAAYELFRRRGVRAVSLDEIIERSGVPAEPFAGEFPAKDELVLAVLAHREQLWTVERIEAETRRRAGTAEGQLLAIFDVFDEWFHEDDFDSCTFINVLLEMGWDHPLGQACILHLSNIRGFVEGLAREAGLREPDEFAHSWNILMKGTIIAAAEGDLRAARRSRTMAESLFASYS